MRIVPDRLGGRASSPSKGAMQHLKSDRTKPIDFSTLLDEISLFTADTCDFADAKQTQFQPLQGKTGVALTLAATRPRRGESNK
jgi:hypothetical protein